MSPKGMVPLASIVIATRNRKTELRAVLKSALAQSVPVEIILVDDGSSDGTLEMVRCDFPQVRLLEFGQNRGPCFQRNRGIEMATCQVVFPIDDDSVLADSKTVEQTLKEFDHPRIGAVAIPFININMDRRVEQLASEPDCIYITSAFVGCSHAIRRDVFLKVGGYREHFFYMGEEDDICLRMLSVGYVVRLGSAAPIHHLQSTNRLTSRANYYGRQNGVLFAWHNVPLASLLVYLPMHLTNSLVYSLRSTDKLNNMRGIIAGLFGIWRYHAQRSAVGGRTFKLFRKMRKSGPIKLESIEANFFTGSETQCHLSTCLLPKVKLESPGIKWTNSLNLSIIIPTYNRGVMLKEAVKSALSQQPIVHEVIVADDGSSDDTVDICRQLQQNATRTKIIISRSEQNYGAQVARNRGLSIATGVAVLFLDSDDVLATDGLRPLIAALEQDRGLDYVYGKVIMTKADLTPENKPVIVGKPFSDKAVELAGYHWHTMAAIYSREFLKQVGQWNVELTGSQDWEFQARVKIAGGRWRFIDHIVGFWRQHEGIRVGTRIFRHDYVRSAEKAALSILKHAETAGMLDSNLKQRMAKKLYLQALECSSNSFYDDRSRLMEEAIHLCGANTLQRAIFRIARSLPKASDKWMFMAINKAVKFRNCLK